MMIAALLALAAGAVAGIFLATRHFMHKRLPVSVALFHGLGGATGFALVLLMVVKEPNFRPIRDVLYLLIATVALGVVNLLFHIRKVRHRTSLILLHGLTAVTAASMLIRAIVVYVPPGEAAAAAVAKPSEPPPASSAPVAGSASAAAPDEGSTAAGAGSAEPSPTAALSAGKPGPEEFVVDEAVRRALQSPIQFETNSATVSEGSAAAISEIASTLKAHPEIALVQVQGHADERGEDGRNVALTRARAAAVVNALVSGGIERERLHSAGYGSRCPDDPACQKTDAPESCHASDNWQRDRRVVFLVLQVGKASFRGEVACAKGASLIPPADRRFHASQ
jgi:outer membrane protein OmpA-like peptidoglycan-associated protein